MQVRLVDPGLVGRVEALLRALPMARRNGVVAELVRRGLESVGDDPRKLVGPRATAKGVA